MGTDTSADRAFFRVRTSIPLRATPVDAEQYQKLASEILTRIEPPLPDIEPELLGWLDRIERKLDRLLSHHDLSEQRSLEDSDRCRVELSGSGLSYPSSEGCTVGASLLLEFELPETPVRTVRCIGRVVQEPSGDDQNLGIAFETIRQVDRDAVVRYTLAVQRQEIRSRGRDKQ